MHSDLQRNLFLVKEHVGMFKASSNYDILDPQTGQPLLYCREPNLGFFTKLLRFTDYKRMTPFEVQIQDLSGRPIITVKRGVSLIRSKVDVFDQSNQKIGSFKQKMISIGGSFTVMSAEDEPLCTLKGKWTSWEFRFLAGDNELAKVSKKWGGLGKEMFTSADNYVLQISEEVPPDQPVRQLIIAAVLCIDMVLKE
jgi:uncharacterized protein YxjI